MPCYSVQTCNVELNNADLGMLEKALKDQGYTVTRNGNTLTFSKGQVSGSYRNNKINMQAPQGVKMDTDAIKRAYSEQVVQKKAREMKAKGWNVYKEKGEYVFKKQQQTGY